MTTTEKIRNIRMEIEKLKMLNRMNANQPVNTNVMSNPPPYPTKAYKGRNIPTSTKSSFLIKSIPYYNNSNNIIPNGMSISSNADNNRRVTCRTPPFKKGIFSYKKRLDFNNNNNNNSNINNNRSTNLSQSSHHNVSMLNTEGGGVLKLNFDKIDNINSDNADNGNSNNIHLFQSKNVKSSVDLTKYKILQSNDGDNNNNNNNNNLLLSSPTLQKNMSLPSYQLSFKSSSNDIGDNFGMIGLSPIMKKDELTLGNNGNNTNRVEGNNKVVKENVEFYKHKQKCFRESRRMMVEYVKLSFHKGKGNTLEQVLKEHNISDKILQQEITLNSNSNGNSNSNNSNSSSHKTQQQQSSNFLSVTQSPHAILFQTPSSHFNNNNNDIPHPRNTTNNNVHNIHKFISEISNDNSSDKLTYINFLSTPRVMNLHMSSTHIQPYIFLLSPNSSAYTYGIETYSFRWLHLHNSSYYGNFDLIKLISCASRSSPSHSHLFELIITNKGNTEDTRSLIIEAPSDEICSTYIKSLNYLAQLVKCKIYQHNVYFNNSISKC